MPDRVTPDRGFFAPRYALLNGHIIDPSTGFDDIGGVLIEGDQIVASGNDITQDNIGHDLPVIDCAQKIVIPGLVDVGVTIGEPGNEHRETLKSAGLAAAAGGVTTIVTMPDTSPTIDDPALIDFIRRGRDMSIVNMHPLGAITKGLKGEEIAEIGLMLENGAVGICDGRTSINNALVMRRAMLYARDFGALLIHHCEDPNLGGSGMMHEGEYASQLGLAGIPSAAEAMVLARDMRLVRLTNTRYHVPLISCADSVDIIKRAKLDGLPVTAGVSINNLCFSDTDLGDYRTFYKLKPPLRTLDERQALIDGINSGIIDVICSNHDPQDVETKRLPFEEAAFGAVGLETLLLGALQLVHSGDCSYIDIIRAMSTKPAELLGLGNIGSLQPGKNADIAIIDPDFPWVLDADKLLSKSKNTPFDKAHMQGKIYRTIVGGKIAHPN